jgi:membrane protease YdiL (CAAX protease family)
MSYKINPQTAYNGMLSGQRNMFLTSSIAIALLGFSENFKHKTIDMIIKIIGMTLFMISIYIGLKTSYDFEEIMNKFKIQENNNKIDLSEWESWKWVSYIYTFILMAIILLYGFRKIIHKIQK